MNKQTLVYHGWKSRIFFLLAYESHWLCFPLHFLKFFLVYFNWFILYSACPVGLYGDECKETCGHCQNKTNCRHTDGLCAGGCSYGYHGNLCKTSKSSNK